MLSINFAQEQPHLQPEQGQIQTGGTVVEWSRFDFAPSEYKREEVVIAEAST
jgi:hypothetical protein